jgi:hypothetical protein
MRESILILVIAAGVLAAPLLCAVGVSAHECVCDTVDCCDDETFCEKDPCTDGYQRENWRQDEISAAVAPQALTGLTPDPRRGLEDSASAVPPRPNLPFPDSDLPLRI